MNYHLVHERQRVIDVKYYRTTTDDDVLDDSVSHLLQNEYFVIKSLIAAARASCFIACIVLTFLNVGFSVSRASSVIPFM